MRAAGFYWVRSGDKWSVAEYLVTPEEWAFPGSELERLDDEFDEIDERRIERQ
jgi:hypothetical protein